LPSRTPTPSSASRRGSGSESAASAPAGAQADGLARLRDLGVEFVRCKGIYYDWVGTLEAARALPDAGAKAIQTRPCGNHHESHVLQQILMRDYRLA